MVLRVPDYVRLKLQTDYALRTLLVLAHKDAQASVDEVATTCRISKDHLFKVVQQLVRLGYVASKPGRSGGVRLARTAAQIRVAEVVAQFEGRHGVLACVEDPACCVMEPGCMLRHMLIDAEQAFYDALGATTIADIIRPNTTTRSGGVYNLTIRGAAVPAVPAARVAEGPAD